MFLSVLLRLKIICHKSNEQFDEKKCNLGKPMVISMNKKDEHTKLVLSVQWLLANWVAFFLKL